jgi:translation initiation factor 6
MFITTNDRFSLVPVDTLKKLEDSVAEGLKTEVMKVSAGDTNLIGLYMAMNSNGIVLPNIIREQEVELLKKTGLNLYISEEKNNAHGNNLAINDKGGIINPNVSDEERRKMEDVLGIEIVPMTIAGYSTVGSACLASNSGFLTHFKTPDHEMAMLKSALKVHGSKGTVNTGTGFVAFGAVVNKNGYIVGENTTAFEMGRIEEALGLIR